MVTVAVHWPMDTKQLDELLCREDLVVLMSCFLVPPAPNHLAGYSHECQVRSRGFTVLGDPHMIPGADMFNHDPNKQSVQIGTDGDDHFVMKTVSERQRWSCN